MSVSVTASRFSCGLAASQSGASTAAGLGVAGGGRAFGIQEEEKAGWGGATLGVLLPGRAGLERRCVLNVSQEIPTHWPGVYTAGLRPGQALDALQNQATQAHGVAQPRTL